MINNFRRFRSELCAFLGVRDQRLSLKKKNPRRAQNAVSGEAVETLRKFYMKEIEDIADLIGRDLSHWLTREPLETPVD
jgi:hypothetical protein